MGVAVRRYIDILVIGGAEGNPPLSVALAEFLLYSLLLTIGNEPTLVC